MFAKLRREPFRLLFPVGALLACAGVVPWALFGTGLTRAYLGQYHALTMTQAFLIAVVVGFLGTMIPRRTGGAPLSLVELLLLVASLLAIPIFLLADRLAVAESAYLVTLVVLLRFAVARMMRSTHKLPVPPSFVLIPIGLAAGCAGACLLIAFTQTQSAILYQLGRGGTEEALLLCVILAVAPMLTPILLHDRAPSDATRAWPRLVHGLVGLGLIASFALQALVSDWLGLLLRGLLVAIELFGAARIAQRPTADGLHRRVYRIALACLPLGLLAASLVPLWRVALMHITFIGGYSLLVFAVSLHVTFLHTGHEALARRSPWPIALLATTTLSALLVRSNAAHFGAYYLYALALAASLWLLGAIVWASYLVRMVLLSRPQRGSA